MAQNKYNSFSTIMRTDFPIPNEANPLPSITVGTDYDLDLENHVGRNYIVFNRGVGEGLSTVFGPPRIFEPEDRPVLRRAALWCNFADGFLATTPSISFALTLINVIPDTNGINLANAVQTVPNQNFIELPILNSYIDISRFIGVNTQTSLANITDSGGLSDTCRFLYLSAITESWKTDIIDTAFDGQTPNFRIEVEVEHTFPLRVDNC